MILCWFETKQENNIFLLNISWGELQMLEYFGKLNESIDCVSLQICQASEAESKWMSQWESNLELTLKDKIPLFIPADISRATESILSVCS